MSNYNEDSPNNVLITGNSKVGNSYVKKTTLDTLHTSSTSIGHSILRPKINDDVILTGSSLGHLHAKPKCATTLDFLTSSDVIAHFKDVQNNMNTVTMSATTNFILSRFKSRTFKNSIKASLGTTLNTIYTCGVQLATLINISAVNITGSPTTITVFLNIGGVQTTLVNGTTIPINTNFVLNNTFKNSPILIMSGDYVQVVSTVNNSLDVYISLLEQAI